MKSSISKRLFEEFKRKYPEVLTLSGQISISKTVDVIELHKQEPKLFEMFENLSEDYRMLHDDYRIKRIKKILEWI